MVPCIFAAFLCFLAFGSAAKPSVDFDHWDVYKEEITSTGEKSITYRSVPFVMQPGQIVFAPQHLKFPPGRYGVTSFFGQVVNRYGEAVPQSQVYVHHWLITNDRKNGGYTPTQTFIFAVGAETRSAVHCPEPYAYIPHEDDKWTAWIHLIDTRYVKDVLICIECRCDDIQHCCDDNTFCQTNEYPDNSGEIYFITYTITYLPFHAAMIPVKTVVLDVTGGHVHYNVPQGTAEPYVYTRWHKQVIPDELEVAWMLGHIHQANINMTHTARTPDGQHPFHCTTIPQVGTGAIDELGNETDYLIGVNMCRWSPPLKIPAGSKWHITAHYDSHEYHGGVMALSIFYAIDYTEWAVVQAEVAAADSGEGDADADDAKRHAPRRAQGLLRPVAAGAGKY